jgi:hypothetical protein
MRTKLWLRGSLIAATLVAGTAFAQTRAPVVTDVGLSPPEERSSAGAILIEDAMPRAHRQAFGVRYTPGEVQAIGQAVMSATFAQIGEEEQGPNTRAMGAAPEPKAADPKAPAKATVKPKP